MDYEDHPVRSRLASESGPPLSPDASHVVQKAIAQQLRALNVLVGPNPLSPELTVLLSRLSGSEERHTRDTESADSKTELSAAAPPDAVSHICSSGEAQHVIQRLRDTLLGLSPASCEFERTFIELLDAMMRQEHAPDETFVAEGVQYAQGDQPSARARK